MAEERKIDTEQPLAGEHVNFEPLKLEFVVLTILPSLAFPLTTLYHEQSEAEEISSCR